MEDCQGDDGAWRLLNSVFCIEPTGKTLQQDNLNIQSLKDGATTTTTSTSTVTGKNIFSFVMKLP